MSANTEISWTDYTWPYVVGCEMVSPGCAGCYAIKDATRMAGNPNPKVSSVFAGLTHRQSNGLLNWTGLVRTVPERLDWPLLWKKPGYVFVPSLGDVFHDDVPFEFNRRAWNVMKQANHHIYQVLTKRPENMKRFVERYIMTEALSEMEYLQLFSHVMLGVSAEAQKEAYERIPHLLMTPAAGRFVSCEPLLEKVSLSNYLFPYFAADDMRYYKAGGRGLDWVIAGGESGPRARPMHPVFAQTLQLQCAQYGVPFHFKQRGDWDWNEPEGKNSVHIKKTEAHGITFYKVGKKRAGRLLNGKTYDDRPQRLVLPEHVVAA